MLQLKRCTKALDTLMRKESLGVKRGEHGLCLKPEGTEARSPRGYVAWTTQFPCLRTKRLVLASTTVAPVLRQSASTILPWTERL